MNKPTDQELLKRYADHQSEAAFAELVRRHVDHVYSAAIRMVCDAHAAKDVTQNVFLALAQDAQSLTDRPILSGWLHRTARNLAAKAVRSSVRRQAREKEAVTMNELLAAKNDAQWEHLAPELDAALWDLREADRDALLLRFFERKSAREMAQVLGISDEAAQKRVNRALERLREHFAKRGIAVGASGLILGFSTFAVQAAPAGLVGKICTASLLAGTASAVAPTPAIPAAALSAFHKAILATVVAACAATPWIVRPSAPAQPSQREPSVASVADARRAPVAHLTSQSPGRAAAPQVFRQGVAPFTPVPIVRENKIESLKPAVKVPLPAKASVPTNALLAVMRQPMSTNAALGQLRLINPASAGTAMASSNAVANRVNIANPVTPIKDRRPPQYVARSSTEYSQPNQPAFPARNTGSLSGNRLRPRVYAD